MCRGLVGFLGLPFALSFMRLLESFPLRMEEFRMYGSALRTRSAGLGHFFFLFVFFGSLERLEMGIEGASSCLDRGVG